MDIFLTEEHKKLREFCREFALKEVKPYAKEIDKKEEFPMRAIKLLCEKGIMGSCVPEEYGGKGTDMMFYTVVIEEISKVCATTALIFSGHQSLGCMPVMLYGTEEQKQIFLPKAATGEWLFAFALTEPGAGTDVQSLQTKAVADGNNYILNGSKIFISTAGYADVFLVFAITGTSINKYGKKIKNCTAFLVKRDDPGFSISKPENKMGIKGSSTCVLNFDNCVIPADRILGGLNEGFKIALQTLDGGRIGIAAQALGVSEGAIEETVKYIKEHSPKGRLGAASQSKQFKLADLYARTQAAKGLVYNAAYKKQMKQPYSMDAAMAKLYAAETARVVTQCAVELCGYDGLSTELPLERMMRDAKVMEIYEGTSEVQRMVIASKLDAQGI